VVIPSVAWADSPETVGAILAEKLSRDWESATIKAPWYPDAYSAMFKDMASDCAMARMGNIAIIDLEKTLNVFHRYLQQRVRQYGLNGQVRIVIAPSRNLPHQEVLFEADGKDILINNPFNHSSAEKSELTRCQAVEMMFTPGVIDWSVNLPDCAKWVTALFPLPFYRLPLYAV
jgi:hypothetical protein